MITSHGVCYGAHTPCAVLVSFSNTHTLYLSLSRERERERERDPRKEGFEKKMDIRWGQSTNSYLEVRE
jgi:hypothetical protein